MSTLSCSFPAIFGGLAILLVHIGLDDLGRQARRQFAVLATFEQDADNDLGVAARSEAHKPAVLGKVSLFSCFARSSQRHDLGRSGLAGDIDSWNMR